MNDLIKKFDDISELHYMDTDSVIVSFKSIEGIIEGLKLFKEDFNFCDLDPAHELYSADKKNVTVNWKLETAPNLDLDEAMFFRSKSDTFNIQPTESATKHKRVQDPK